ncbi:hypothetical protein [Pseudomonas sp. PGPPP2]|uniref:hypothetical protein n=1 Tax=Pseudomonas sp. PGPPP2 TaxID=2015554 RepID=UPI000BCC932D|nr:hypothetical protein [Pseudomonas sp. PGPPP2]OYT79642.1 MAG: hypothetical protein CFE48_10785 [Pseudomonas sp. PGPPP2]
MRGALVNSLMLLTMAISGAGCTTYASRPIINDRVEAAKTESIPSFTYEVDAPWKDSRFGKRAYQATQEIIPAAQDISSAPLASSRPVLAIKISEFSSGGACTQEYLTGLSLGLIPSWCTRPTLFTFQFMLNGNHGVCRQKTYSISAQTFSHITAIPFAMLDTRDQPLTLYQAALKDFLQPAQCATP